MGKDTHLINIYLKIHNKKTLTMDDLRYLAEYAPECFEKTCKNVVYNLPEAKKIMEPAPSEPLNDAPLHAEPQHTYPRHANAQNTEPASTPSERENIEMVLENIRQLEAHDFPVANVDADEVKSLLGNLYMELLFPHNDQDTFINSTENRYTSLFDKRV